MKTTRPNANSIWVSLSIGNAAALNLYSIFGSDYLTIRITINKKKKNIDKFWEIIRCNEYSDKRRAEQKKKKR